MKRSIALGAFVMAACSAAAGHVGGLMEDGGALLRDAGELLRDAGRDSDGARAQAPDENVEMSGTRLKARYTTTTYKGADGATNSKRDFIGWFDSRRNEACSVSMAPDGKMRCLPSVAVGTQSVFADATCSKPVVMVSKASSSCGASEPDVLKYLQVTSIDESGCAKGRIVPATKAVVTTVYTKGATGTCSMDALMDLYVKIYDFYDPTGAEIAYSEFVEFTVTEFEHRS